MGKREEETLKEAAAWVAYEYYQFRWARKNMPEDWQCGTGGNSKEADAAVEIALLHARNLRDFFYKDRSVTDNRDPQYAKPTDVVTQDFVENWRVPKFAYLAGELRKRLNAALAHLSYNRAEHPGSEPLDWDQVDSEIDDAWTGFLRLLEDRRAWFEESNAADLRDGV